jgi:hypothetical protein
MTDDERKLTREELDELAAELLPERTQMSVLWHTGAAPVVSEEIGVPTDPEAPSEPPDAT